VLTARILILYTILYYKSLPAVYY